MSKHLRNHSDPVEVSGEDAREAIKAAIRAAATVEDGAAPTELAVRVHRRDLDARGTLYQVTGSLRLVLKVVKIKPRNQAEERKALAGYDLPEGPAQRQDIATGGFRLTYDDGNEWVEITPAVEAPKAATGDPAALPALRKPKGSTGPATRSRRPKAAAGATATAVAPAATKRRSRDHGPTRTAHGTG